MPPTARYWVFATQLAYIRILRELRVHFSRGVDLSEGHSNTAAEVKSAELAAVDVARELAWRLVEAERGLFDGQQNGGVGHALSGPPCKVAMTFGDFDGGELENRPLIKVATA
jgi:hypothetical protein